ncbi:MAG: hypothetical protein DHS20C15_32250 [Planctomycetota bacterium]|nr:MAG: hypothetical protein DHS20C15_32250 [Planctomycetota bacterium]
MNKAFVREVDAPDPGCPQPRGCGATGQNVPLTALRAQLAPEDAARFPQGAFYCATPTCPVVFFDRYGALVEVAALRDVPYPKDPEGVVCACLSIRAAQIIDEARAGRRQLMRTLVEAGRSDSTRCVNTAVNGRPCEAEARRLFLQYFDSSPRA